MLNELNRRLEACREQIRYKEKRENRIKILTDRKKELEHSLAIWKEQLEEEEADVELLLSMSFSNLWYTLLRKKGARLEKEQLEVLEAKVKADQAAASLAETERELEEATEALRSAGHAEVEYKSLLVEKEQTIQRHYPELAAELSALTDRKAAAAVRLKEWKEAYYEGTGALNALSEALNNLESAKNWGTYDLLGGGLISTSIKHSRMEEAVANVHLARQRLIRFKAELEDIRLEYAVDTLDMSGLLRFSDYFFDGILVDYAVQGRIKEALAQVSEQISELRGLVRHLEEETARCESEIAQLERQFSSLVETSGGP